MSVLLNQYIDYWGSYSKINAYIDANLRRRKGEPSGNGITISGSFGEYIYTTDGRSNYNAYNHYMTWEIPRYTQVASELVKGNTGTSNLHNTYWLISHTFTLTTNPDASSVQIAAQYYDSTGSPYYYSDWITPYINCAAWAPNCPTVTLSSRTHNTATFSVSVGSYGTSLPSQSGRYIEACVLQTQYYDGSTSNARRWKSVTNTSSASITVTNSDSGNGGPSGAGLTMIGNSKYYYGGYATNTVSTASNVVGSFYTTPPPLSALSVSSTHTASGNNDKVSFTYAYDTSLSASVAQTLQYRLSTDNGSTWGSWSTATSVAAGTGTGSFNLTIAGNKDCKVQCRLYYSTSGLNGTSKEVSFHTYQRPQGLTHSVVSKTKNTITLQGSTTGFGYPVGNTAKLQLGVLAENATSLTARRGVNLADLATSGSATVTNSSSAWDGGVTITGNTRYSTYTYATNTTWSHYIVSTNSVVTLPYPAKTFVESSQSRTTTYAIETMSYTLDTTNDGKYYSETGYYSIDGTNWVSIGTLSNSGSFTITGLDFSTTYVIYFKIVTTAGESEVVSVIINTMAPPVTIYYPVNNTSKKVWKWYGSVENPTTQIFESKKIRKWYGSVNGLSKLIHEDS